MSIKDIKKALSRTFQGVLKNIVSLANDSTLESDLKPLKVGQKSTPLEISESELKVNGTINAEAINVNGSAVQTGTDVGATELNELSDVTYSSGDLTISSLDKIISGNLEFDSSGNITIDTDGHTEFNSPAGFDQFTPTYNASDTEVNFKTDGNKAFVTFGSGNITDLNLNLPATSGNFVLLLKQDGTGSRTVTNYKAFDSGGAAANGSATVKFAGGSNPTLTTDANHVDILSFYWDADNEICYGVASLDFQF